MDKTVVITDLSFSRNLYEIETQTPQSAAGEESTYYSPSVLSSAHTYASLPKSHYATAKRLENINNNNNNNNNINVHNYSNDGTNINNNNNNNNDNTQMDSHEVDELSAASPIIPKHNELLDLSQVGGPCSAPLPSERLDTSVFHHAVAEVLVGLFADASPAQCVKATKVILSILEAGGFPATHVVYAVALLRRVTMADEEAEEAYLEECQRREENNTDNNNNNHSGDSTTTSSSSSPTISSPTTTTSTTATATAPFHHTFTACTVRLIFPMALLITAKVHMDWYPELSHMVKVAGLHNTDFSRQRMSAAEVTLITALQYRVHVTAAEFAEVEEMIIREANEYMSEMMR